MMITREYTADNINAVINHPAVHPWVAVAGQGELDLSGLVEDGSNVLLMADRGGFMFHRLEPAVYEVHTQFLPEGRGRHALKAARAALHHMFTGTDCMEVLTKCPVNNPATAWMARHLGFTLEFTRPAAWPHEDGLVDVDYYALRYPEWVKSAPGLDERGHWFHDRLHAEKARLGLESPDHPEDAAHDRHVGACVEMLLAGQPDKALILYNRWARFAGYATLDLASRAPLVIDIRDGLLLINDTDFEVL